MTDTNGLAGFQYLGVLLRIEEYEYEQKMAITLKPNEYRCAVCKQIFDKGLTDEEATAQYAKEFPHDQHVPLTECDLVCDDCFKEMSESGIFPELA